MQHTPGKQKPFLIIILLVILLITFFLQRQQQKISYTADPTGTEEHEQFVDKITSLSTLSRLQYQFAITNTQRIDLLLEDLLDTRHYVVLGAFNFPSAAKDFIINIEAGKLLVALATQNPETRPYVVEKMVNALFTEYEEKTRVPDGRRGAILYFLGEILSAENRLLLKETLTDVFPSNMYGEESNIPTFTQYYLEKLIA